MFFHSIHWTIKIVFFVFHQQSVNLKDRIFISYWRSSLSALLLFKVSSSFQVLIALQSLVRFGRATRACTGFVRVPLVRTQDTLFAVINSLMFQVSVISNDLSTLPCSKSLLQLSKINFPFSMEIFDFCPALGHESRITWKILRSLSKLYSDLTR